MITTQRTNVLTFLMIISSGLLPEISGFVQQRPGTWGIKTITKSLSTMKSSTDEIDIETVSAHEVDDNEDIQAVRAPLKYIGPYPCLALRFPNLATSSQRERNVTGVSLDFVLDTAANTNTIQKQVAQELKLPVVGHALPGVSSAGPIFDGGDTYLLGDSELDGVTLSNINDEKTDEDDNNNTMNNIFMTNLTASALPVASPAAAGLLSLAFLQIFEGGVEFQWNGNIEKQEPPSITFIGDKSMDDVLLKDKVMVPIERIPITQLPSVTVTINGVDMPALLDTGSPITVLNAQAAKVAGVETVEISKGNKNKMNPFASVTDRFQQAQAAARGDVLMIAGVNGKPVNLIKSKDSVNVSFSNNVNEQKQQVDFGSVPLYVGDIPGLAALNGIGVKSPPAVVLGMDVLRQRPSMLLRAQDNQIWF